jgi:hypothetical protein
MGCTVAEAQARVSPAEFREWVAFSRSEPFSDQRMEYMLALVACIVANANRGKGRPFKIDEFIPKWGKPQMLDPRDQYRILEAQVKAHNAMRGK